MSQDILSVRSDTEDFSKGLTIEECTPEPNPFPPGACINLRLSSGMITILRVLKPFLPFTKSQVYLVQLDSTIDSNYHNLPSIMVVKVYDPRYLDDRIPKTQSSYFRRRWWSLDAETEAALYRQEVAEGKRQKNPLVDQWWTYQLHSRRNEEPYIWEALFFSSMQHHFETEVAILTRLKEFQGKTIPNLYGKGNVVCLANLRAIEPTAVLLEYILNTPLKDLDDSDDSKIPPSIFDSLVDTVKAFAGLGIRHDDLNATNILITPSAENPSKGVLIDFGHSILRWDDCTDEFWTEGVSVHGDLRRLRSMLLSKGIRLKDTP